MSESEAMSKGEGRGEESHAGYSVTDGRSQFRKWWDSKTSNPAPPGFHDGSLLVHCTIRLSWRDALLCLFGRWLHVETRSPASDEQIIAAVAGCVSHVWTEPHP
jgi:hypothetical protein